MYFGFESQSSGEGGFASHACEMERTFANYMSTPIDEDDFDVL